MKTYYIGLFVWLAAACATDEKPAASIPCTDDWVFVDDAGELLPVTEEASGDTLTQVKVGDQVWFDMIRPTVLEGNKKQCYLRNYRMDGSLQSEGLGIYYEDPIQDYTPEGPWIFYTCNGAVQEQVEFVDGKRVEH